MADVVILNTTPDTIALLREVVEDEGWSAVGDFIVDFRQGRKDIGAFFQEHQPHAVIYDLAIPYQENWQFLVETVVPASGHTHKHFVLTTTNKRALEQIVGSTPALELIGRPFDLDEIIQAVRRALAAD